MLRDTFWGEPKKAVLLQPAPETVVVFVNHTVFHTHTHIFPQCSITMISVEFRPAAFCCTCSSSWEQCSSSPWQWTLQRQRKRGSWLCIPQMMRSLPFKSCTALRCLLQLAPQSPKSIFMKVSREDGADLQVLIPVILCFMERLFFCWLNRSKEMLV